MSRSLKPLLLFIVLTLSLSACNRVGLAYRNLDVIIPWTLGDYLDMNREQKDWFDERLKEHLSWHCGTQVPGYLDWLDRLQTMVETNRISDADVQARTVEAKQAIADIAREITPSAIQLLRGLDDRQVEEMNLAFAKDLRKREADYVSPPLEQQIQQRADRMSKRLTAWMGELNPTQKARIEQWSTELGEQNREWIANRAHWQRQFSRAVEQRQDSHFPQRIEELLQHREQLWTADYRQAYARTEAAARSLLLDLMAQSSVAQRQQLVKKIGQTRQDFTELKCLKTARQN